MHPQIGTFVPLFSRLTVSLLLLLTAQSSATTLDTALWLLRVSEELHRTFKTERGVQVVEATGTDGYLCAKKLHSNMISRKNYEDSWTGVKVANTLQAVFNLTCFTSSPDACMPYMECQDASQLYPADPSHLGQPVFLPATAALKGLHWASSSAAVEAWELEVTVLQAQLALHPDENSEQAQFLRKALTAAASAADTPLRLGTTSLLGLTKQRILDFKSNVRAATAPAPAPESAALPSSLETLAIALEALAVATEGQPCSANIDWAILHQSIHDNLKTHSSAVSFFNASGLLQLKDFDYAQRAVEALTVGAALAMEAGAVASLAEYGCQLQHSPRTAAVRDLALMRKDAHALMTQVSTALPTPADGNLPSAPLQRCLSQRVAGATSAISAQAATTGGPARNLLSLDFCARLFDALAHVVVQIVPGAEAAPSASSTLFASNSGEERRIHASADQSYAYISPYLDIVTRGVDDNSGTQAFAGSDKVLQLRQIADDNVHAAGPLPNPNLCSGAQVGAWLASRSPPQCDLYDQSDKPCTVPGCWRSGGFCFAAGSGQYTSNGADQVPCPQGDLTPAEALFYARGWPNSSCPFICHQADRVRNGLTCQPVTAGYYSPTCSNEKLACSVPQGLSGDLFCAVARFTGPGQGSPSGCEVQLAAPLAGHGHVDPLMPPLTVELWAKVAIDDIPEPHAILMGTFPEWYVAIRKASATAIQIGLYHHFVTQAVSSREDSVTWSQPFPWSTEWRHIAATVTTIDDTTPNVHFYSNGELISSAQRSAVVVAYPNIQPCQLNTFHIGVPNPKLSPEVVKDGRTEPYYDVSGSNLFFPGQIDEVRVSKIALDGLTQGGRITEMRRQAACDVPFERLEGSTCRPSARVTAHYGGEDGCQAGYEMCGSRPGLCVTECSRGTLRQSDCTCDCPPGKFQTWYVQAIYLTGSGAIGNVTVYDTAHNIILKVSNTNLPYRFDITPPRQVSVITVQGTGSATAVSLDVETVTGTRLQVPDYRNVPLPTDRLTILHHRRLHEFFDPSLSCATCPGDLGVVLGSQLPRADALSCLCSKGYGRNLLGRCVPLREPLTAPTMSIAPGYHEPGTRVRLQEPNFYGEGPWLLEVHYEVSNPGEVTPTPTCLSSPKYHEDPAALSLGNPVGLDFIRRKVETSVCAVACHPMHQDSPPVCKKYIGNDHMNPPRCIITGNWSRPSTTYALQATIAFAIDGNPGATIYYRPAGTQQLKTYQGPITFTTPGMTALEVYGEELGFSTSAISTCRFEIDAAPRLDVGLSWPEGADPQLGGFSHGEGAFMVKRSVETLRFKLQERATGGGSPAQVEIEYRLAHGSQPHGAWLQVAGDGFINLGVQESLQAPATNTLLSVQWHVRELGYIWSEPTGIKFLLVASQAGQPTIEVTPTASWGVGDSWLEGPLRDSALRQVHHVELHPPTATARLLYKLGDWEKKAPLLAINEANVSSLHSSGLIEKFRTKPTLPDWGPDQQGSQCGPDLGLVETPTLCEYLGPFQVLGGTKVTAFALDPAQLESAAAIVPVAKMLEPTAGDPRFNVNVGIQGTHVSLSSLPGVHVLPSTATTVEMESLSPEGVDRQSCILTSKFLVGAPQQQAPLHLRNCTWVAYNGVRRLQLPQLLQQAGVTDNQGSLNITVLMTMQRAGFLWTYPTSVTYIWLREQTPPPSIVGVIEPGLANHVSAMVWIRSEGVGAENADFLHSHHPSTGADRARCYFTLRNIPVTDEDLPKPWLVEVPGRTTTVETVRDAMLKTQEPTTHAFADWTKNIRVCTWPSICELPLNGTLPGALIQAPADIPRLCTWAVWYGYRASVTNCELMGPTARVKQAKIAFATGSLTEQQLAGSDGMDFPMTQVGFDTKLSAAVVKTKPPPVVSPGSNVSSFRRLSSIGLPLFVERTHPLQYRYAATAFDPVNIPRGVDQLLGSTAFTAWQNLDLADPTPLVPLPNYRASYDQHVLVAVDVRLLIGINRWGQQSRSYCVVLEGEHPAAVTQVGRRALNISSPRANSTILFRWALGDLPDLTSAGAVVQLQPNFQSITSAYALTSPVHNRLMPQGTPYNQCLAPQGQELLDELAGVVGMRLCSSEGPLELHAPDHQRWTLWAAIYGKGLAMSPVVTHLVEPQCLVPNDIRFANTPACAEGDAIDSGATCSPSCFAGYTPTFSSRTCTGGRPSSVAFACEESACNAPVDVGNVSAVSPCVEGSTLASGTSCTPQCAAGYTSLTASLGCSRGKLTPASFSCFEAPCAAPSGIVNAPSACSGLASVASGEKCVAQCKPGYVPSEEHLRCSKGTFSPASFVCLEITSTSTTTVTSTTTSLTSTSGTSTSTKSSTTETETTTFTSTTSSSTVTKAWCFAPAGIENAAASACREGSSIQPGSPCTPVCKEGFQASVNSMNCSEGKLVPASFSCAEVGFSLPIDPVAGGTIAAGFFALLLTCCLLCFFRRRYPAEQANDANVSDNKAALKAWLNMVKDVAPGMCVFCGQNPVSSDVFSEKDHGPETSFQCCNSCSQFIPPDESVNGSRRSYATSQASRSFLASPASVVDQDASGARPYRGKGKAWQADSEAEESVQSRRGEPEPEGISEDGRAPSPQTYGRQHRTGPISSLQYSTESRQRASDGDEAHSDCDSYAPSRTRSVQAEMSLDRDEEQKSWRRPSFRGSGDSDADGSRKGRRPSGGSRSFSRLGSPQGKEDFEGSRKVQRFRASRQGNDEASQRGLSTSSRRHAAEEAEEEGSEASRHLLSASEEEAQATRSPKAEEAPPSRRQKVATGGSTASGKDRRTSLTNEEIPAI